MSLGNKDLGEILAKWGLSDTLGEISESDVTYLAETFSLLHTLYNLEERITTRQPYHEINRAKISDSVRKQLLQFNALYQIAEELSQPNSHLSDFQSLELTQIQSEMPREYVVKCILFNLITKYHITPRASAKEDLNRRLIGGFFSKYAEGILPDSLDEKAKAIVLPEEYQKHFDTFVEATNNVVSAHTFGAVMGSLRHL